MKFMLKMILVFNTERVRAPTPWTIAEVRNWFTSPTKFIIFNTKFIILMQNSSFSGLKNLDFLMKNYRRTAIPAWTAGAIYWSFVWEHVWPNPAKISGKSPEITRNHQKMTESRTGSRSISRRSPTPRASCLRNSRCFIVKSTVLIGNQDSLNQNSSIKSWPGEVVKVDHWVAESADFPVYCAKTDKM